MSRLNYVILPVGFFLEKIDELLTDVNETLPKGVEIDLHVYGLEEVTVCFWNFNEEDLVYNSKSINLIPERSARKENGEIIKKAIVEILHKNGYATGGKLFEIEEDSE